MTELSYLSINAEARIEFVERKSLFIGEAKPCTSEAEALEFIEAVRRREPEATHHVYAYVIGTQGSSLYQRFSDAGEPKGTAGKPLLDAILGRGLTNIAVVVTRYFGGVLLGAGGLVRAYSHTALQAIDAAQIVKWQLQTIYELTLPYNISDLWRYYLKTNAITLLDERFTDQVTFVLAVPAAKVEALAEYLAGISAGKIELQKVGEEYRQLLSTTIQ